MSVYPKYVSQSPLSANKQATQDSMFQKITVTHSNPLVSKSALPAGWRREEIVRANGLSSGKSVVFYVSPSGVKVNSLKELQNIVGDKINLSTFDWRTGKFNVASKHKIQYFGDQPSAKNAKLDGGESDWFKRGSQMKFVKPIVKVNHNDSKHSEKLPTSDSLKQLFAERRLAGQFAIDHRNGKTIAKPTLPPCIESAGVPGYGETQLLQNLMATLATSRGIIKGQERSVEHNPCALLNQNQPYVKTFVVTEDDIRKQAQRVEAIRNSLQTLRKAFAEGYPI